MAVRWDYAFFQMLIETNYLTFRRPNGVPASVVPTDNNFAGVGAAISGRPGERFKDVATGVLAHLQHVLMYSTTRVPDPVAQRTRQVQDDVQQAMRRLHRPVTFADLAREWTGTDHNAYGGEMQQAGGDLRQPLLRARPRAATSPDRFRQDHADTRSRDRRNPRAEPPAFLLANRTRGTTTMLVVVIIGR